MTKLEALAAHLECGADELTQSTDDETLFTWGRDEYLVCTDEEADAVAAERIEQDLWAFKADFILTFLRLDRSDRTVKAFEEMQGKLCEDAQPLVRSMIGDKLGDFVRQAISADGRGHFIAGYDGCENYAAGFNIYRIN